ncbi:YdeI/OmpD-associated family protein [Cohnella soli]|uniref:YdeI family protein n=1 Tax=Cohnella soli TaxID=425005 RepID=A0ABW0HYK6_9BACL
MDEALVKKLRVPAVGAIALYGAPEGFAEKVGLVPADVNPDPASQGAYDYVQLFAYSSDDVVRLAPAALRAARAEAIVWLCYPKGTSKIKTDLHRDKGWEPVIAAGWEGVSLVSVDDTWSAMRFRPVGAAGARPRPAAKAAGSEAAVLVEPPAELLAALAGNSDAAHAFDKLAPSHRKEYIQWINEAKKEETRIARIGKTVEKLAAGLKRPSDKQ